MLKINSIKKLFLSLIILVLSVVLFSGLAFAYENNNLTDVVGGNGIVQGNNTGTAYYKYNKTIFYKDDDIVEIEYFFWQEMNITDAGWACYDDLCPQVSQWNDNCNYSYDNGAWTDVTGGKDFINSSNLVGYDVEIPLEIIASEFDPKILKIRCSGVLSDTGTITIMSNSTGAHGVGNTQSGENEGSVRIEYLPPPPPPPIPEFTTIGIILVLVITIIGVSLIRKK